MASEEDNFDIDIYGDEGDVGTDYKQEVEEDYKLDDETATMQVNAPALKEETPAAEKIPITNKSAVGEPATAEVDLPRQAPQQQGDKRKESSDERLIDPGSTNALMISELHWWITEDDIRGWANQASCEDELTDVTFSEHKVNGKSKGQAFVDFTSPQAATATKHKIESLANEQPTNRKHTVAFANHFQNPFKTSPKDAPARQKEERAPRATSGTYSAPTHQNNYQNSNNFRGGRGGFNNRGGYNNAGSYNQNRNFSGQQMGGGYGNMATGGFQNNLPMMNNNFGGYNRGGMGAMRGGRGGMNTMNAMMPMNGMAIGMNPMMGNMGMQGYQPNANMFNPAMFNQAGNQGNWGQHTNKRQRQE